MLQLDLSVYVRFLKQLSFRCASFVPISFGCFPPYPTLFAFLLISVNGYLKQGAHRSNPYIPEAPSFHFQQGSGLTCMRDMVANVLCFQAKNPTFTVPLSAQEYKWHLSNCQGSSVNCEGVGGNLVDWHPIQRWLVILLVASCQGN